MGLVLDIFGNAAGIGIVAGCAWFVFKLLTEKPNSKEDKAIMCPACGYDLRSSPDFCPECGRPSMGFQLLDIQRLTEELPASPMIRQVTLPEEVPVTVHVTPNVREASLLAAQLRLRGMPCELRNLTQGSTVPDFGPGGAPVHVVVWSQDAESARAYVKSITVKADLDPHRLSAGYVPLK